MKINTMVLLNSLVRTSNSLSQRASQMRSHLTSFEKMLEVDNEKASEDRNTAGMF